MRLAESIRRGETSATNEVARALNRAEAHNELNIFTRLDPVGARQRAADIDSAIAEGKQVGPLAGVPIVVKDLINQAQIPNTCGGSFAPYTPLVTAPALTRLETAGAVIIGRAGLHEFAFGLSSENSWHGPVRNPCGSDLSVGGSSGGSAAAVAADIAPIAIGTDTGGSVRVPAALCGVFGLKVTHGKVPTEGVFPLAPGLDTVGPIADSVESLTAAYQVLSGDQSVVPSVELSELRLGVPHPWVDTNYEPTVAQQFAGAIDQLQSMGTSVSHVQAPLLNPPGMAIASAYFEAATVHRTRFQADPCAYAPDVREHLALAMTITEAEHSRALQWRAEIRKAALEAMDQCDALLTPTTTAITKRIGVDQLQLDGGPVHYRVAFSHFGSLVNNSSLPAVACPIRSFSGRPASMQLVGRYGHESQILAIARSMEGVGIVGR